MTGRSLPRGGQLRIRGQVRATHQPPQSSRAWDTQELHQWVLQDPWVCCFEGPFILQPQFQDEVRKMHGCPGFLTDLSAASRGWGISSCWCCGDASRPHFSHRDDTITTAREHFSVWRANMRINAYEPCTMLDSAVITSLMEMLLSP